VAKKNGNIDSIKIVPDHFTQVSFYMNLAVCAYFLFWNILTLIALNNLSIILKYKQLPIWEMIERRGKILGFETGEFQAALNQNSAITLILFIPVIIGLFLLWRKNTLFYPFLMFGTLLQILSMIILLGPTYFWNDSTFMDKLCWLILLVNSTIYWALLKKEVKFGKISFFDED
jgi:hypothetical protein